MTEKAGDDDLGYVRCMGTAAGHTHHSEEEKLRGFLKVFRRSNREVDRERRS